MNEQDEFYTNNECEEEECDSSHDYFLDLENEVKGWTIVSWDRETESGETTRMICEKDGTTKAVFIIATDLGMGVDKVQDFDTRINQVIWDDLEDMVYEITEHQYHMHTNHYPERASIPEWEDSYTEQEYIDNYVDYWMQNDNTIQKAIKVKTKKQKEYNYIFVHDSFGGDYYESTFYVRLDGDIGFNIVYVDDENLDDFLSGVIPLPEEYKKWNLKNIETINSPYYINFEDKHQKEIEENKKHFEDIRSPIMLRLGYRCKDCGKEWWIGLNSTRKCKNIKLVKLIADTETSMDIFDKYKWDYDEETDTEYENND